MARQEERRELFNTAFGAMPLWSTWVDKVLVRVDSEAVKEIQRGNFKAIPRRLRREMARLASKRNWRGARGLPELITS